MNKQHGDHHVQPPTSRFGGRHKSWFVAVVILMLIGMVIYIFTLDESIRPAPVEEPEAGQSVE